MELKIHSLTVNDETNFLNLISSSLDINCQIITKVLQYQNLTKHDLIKSYCIIDHPIATSLMNHSLSHASTIRDQPGKIYIP